MVSLEREPKPEISCAIHAPLRRRIGPDETGRGSASRRRAASLASRRRMPGSVPVGVQRRRRVHQGVRDAEVPVIERIKEGSR